MTIMVTGSCGLLGKRLTQTILKQNKTVIALYNNNFFDFKSKFCFLKKINLYNLKKLDKLVEKFRPQTIIHCAGLTDVDKCEKFSEKAHFLHVKTSEYLAVLSKKIGAQFILISTDHLFDGESSNYSETSKPKPLNIYAKTKFEGEKKSLEANSNILILRTNFFGLGTPWRESFSDFLWNSLRKKKKIFGFADCFFTPISIPIICDLMMDLIEKKPTGIFNLCGSERLSKFSFANKFADFFNFDKSLITPIEINKIKLVAKRPNDMSLSTKKIEKYLVKKMPNIEQSLRSIEKDYVINF